MMSLLAHMSSLPHTLYTHSHIIHVVSASAKYINVLLFLSYVGDIIVQIDRQDLSHMSLAQATLALGTSSPLIRLGVYRPSSEDSTLLVVK